MSTRIVEKQRPPVKKQGRLMRSAWRENPEDGTSWGNWLDVPPEPPDPEPLASPPPPAVPTASNTKTEIVAWLHGQGVTLSDSALMALTKDELLSIVDDIVNGVVDPGDVTVP